MKIRIEFDGIPRDHAGVPAVELHDARPALTLGDVLLLLADRFPRLANCCFPDSQLAPGVLAQLQGRRYIRQSGATIPDGATLRLTSSK